MKKSDIAMIILIASVSVGISFAVVNQIPFFKDAEKGQKVDVTTRIDPTVGDPDPLVFNANAINPTVQTIIGGGQAAQ